MLILKQYDLVVFKYYFLKLDSIADGNISVED